MAQVRSARAMKTRKEKKRGSITRRTDRANEGNKMLIISVFFYYSGRGTKSFDVVTCDQELEVRTGLTDLKLTSHSTRNKSAI